MTEPKIGDDANDGQDDDYNDCDVFLYMFIYPRKEHNYVNFSSVSSPESIHLIGSACHSTVFFLSPKEWKIIT